MSEDPAPEEVNIPQDTGESVVTRRANDFKQSYADHFNFTISEKNIEIQIISDNTFGATQFARDSVGLNDPSAADREFVEEQALKLRTDSAKELTSLLLQSIVKKEVLDGIAMEQDGVDQEVLERVGGMTIEPQEVEEIIQRLKEDKFDNEY